MSSGSRTSPSSGILRGLLVSLATFLFLALLAEGGLRLALFVKGQSYDSAATRATIAALVDETAGELPGLQNAAAETPETKAEETGDAPAEEPRRYQLHPYTGYHLEGTEEVVQSSLEYLASPEGREAFTIFVLGGSVATIFSCEPIGGHERLEEVLEQSGRFGNEVKVLPFACPAHKQPQQLEMLAYLLSLGARPDMVISLDGYNEVRIGPTNTLGGQPFSYPSYSYWVHLTGAKKFDYDVMDLMLTIRERQREALEEGQRALDGIGLHSAILGRLALERVKRAQHGWAAAQSNYVAHRAAAGRTAQRVTRTTDEDELPTALQLEEAVDVWYESSLLVQALCKQRGIRYVNALQPTLATGSKAPTTEERERGLRRETHSQSVAEGYLLLRARAEGLRAAGIEFHDLTGIFDGIEETIYIDACHVVARGNQILADELAAALLGAQ